MTAERTAYNFFNGLGPAPDMGSLDAEQEAALAGAVAKIDAMMAAERERARQARVVQASLYLASAA